MYKSNYFYNFFYYRVLVKHRASLAGLHDALVACFAWYLAFLLRFNFNIPSVFIQSLLLVLVIAVPIQWLLFKQFGLYKGIWRFASIPDLKRILLAVAISAVTISTLLLMSEVALVPRSVLLLDPLLLVLFVGGSRFTYRAWQEHRLYGLTAKQGRPVIILGAGETAIALVKDLSRSEDWKVIGLLDDDMAIHGRQLMGVKVFGGISDLPELASDYQVRHVIIAMPFIAHQVRRVAIEIANECNLTVLTVPAFDDLMNGKVNISQIRPVDVEDLLGRDAVKLDATGLHHLIDHKTVLVTGAGGSIGAELCRQILKFKPATLICLDISEYALYTIEQQFLEHYKNVRLVFLTGDVKNLHRIKTILDTHQPSVVFHAAAYKHVPLMENGNVFEALANNVIGTHTIASACQAAGVEKFVLVSTDKAVNPTNIMGASKRLAEMVCQGLQFAIAADVVNKHVEPTIATQFVVVRFGNVLGSSGSVIPKFKEQIAKGGPITITHPDITRYFMSISEAAQLVMQAGLMGNGGEIFVLDMGESVKILNLAKDMIRLSGMHDDEIKIEFTGLRPGEKLYEELLADGETTIPTPHEKLRIAKSRVVDNLWLSNLLKWLESAKSLSERQIKVEMKFWVEEYQMQDQIKLELDSTISAAHQLTLH